MSSSLMMERLKYKIGISVLSLFYKLNYHIREGSGREADTLRGEH
jgi:hypothetical protein